MSTPQVIPPALADRFTDEDVARLVALRRDLHAHPELSWQEHRTADALAAELERLQPAALDRVAGTGLVVRIAGRDRSAPVVAVRGDIDALPIQEATGLSFTSRHDGVMHACGHDVHAAWAVGAARLLARDPAAGDVLIVLQPAEELGEGAMQVLASGALDDVRMIFGGHVDRRFEVGQVVAEEGALAASSDTFAITVTGHGAHGARPHEADDPIVGAAALVGALQTIVARRIDPGVAGVITVGTINAGSAPNVIPGQALLGGTIRATTADTRLRLHDELRRVAAGIASAHSLEIAVDITTGTPPIVNLAGPARLAAGATRELLGTDAVVPFGVTNMGGEDFAFYLERMPGCFLRIGARERGGAWFAAHSPRFVAAEESLFVGAAVLAACARAGAESLA